MSHQHLPLEEARERFDFWSDHVDHLINDRDIDELWPPQIEAFESGVLNDANFLLVSPPGTGKTLVAEIAAVTEWFANMGTSVYLVPYTSLAEEKYQEFKENLGGELGLDVRKSTEDDYPEPAELFDAQILVMTYEKFDYYLRNNQEYISNLGCVIVDEFHKISDPERGPNLEVAVTELLTNYPQIKIIGLSATIPNYEEVAQWINGEFSYSGDWRLNELHEGIYIEEKRELVFYRDGAEIGTEAVNQHYEEGYKENAIIDFLIEEAEKDLGGQALGFAPRRKDAKETATNIADFIESHQRSYDFDLDSSALNMVRDQIEDLPDRGRNIKKLKSCLSSGVGFHHAGLSYRVKDILEDAFERGDLKALIATSTLAAGINLPIKRVFVLRPRYGGAQGRNMRVSEYKNLVGRAGRPTFTDEPGESVLFATSDGQAAPLIANYIQGDIDRLKSKIDLGEDHSLLLNLVRDHPQIPAVLGFLNNSFLGTGGSVSESDIGDNVGEAIIELENQDMLEQTNEMIQLTSLGEATSKQLVSPRSLHLVRTYLEENDEFEVIGLLMTIASAPEFNNGLRLWLEDDLVYTKRDEVRQELDLKHIPTGEFDNVMATGFVIEKWISEEDLDDVFEELNIDAEYWGTADVRERIVPQYIRILKATFDVLEETQSELYDEYGNQLEKLRIRVQHGLGEDGAEFVRQNITSDREIILDLRNRVGISTPNELLQEDIQDLIPKVGRQRALEHKRRAVFSLLDGYERDRELTVLDALESNLDSQSFESLLSTDREQFQRCVISELRKIDQFYIEEADERGGTYEPECYIYLVTDDGAYLQNENGEDYEIAVECKSKKDLDGKVSAGDATAIVQKAPESDIKLTVGAPGFVSDADDAALEAHVLLLSSTGFGTLMVHLQSGDLSIDEIIDIFEETGYMDRGDVLNALP